MRSVRISCAIMAALLCFSSVRVFAADKEWKELGSRKVDFKTEKDVIEVGKEEGKFTAIRFKVEDADMDLQKIKVTFANGETFEPDTKIEFKEGSHTRDIDLPKSERTIKKVEFIYHSAHKHESATVVLYGKRS